MSYAAATVLYKYGKEIQSDAQNWHSVLRVS